MKNGMRLLVLTMAAVCIGSLTLAAMAMAQPEAPLIITQAKWIDSNACSGVLRYSTTVAVVEAPSVVAIYRSIWSMDARTTVVSETQPRFAPMSEKQTTTRENEYTLPGPLPPGRYELRLAALSFQSKPSIRTLAFTVPATCP